MPTSPQGRPAPAGDPGPSSLHLVLQGREAEISHILERHEVPQGEAPHLVTEAVLAASADDKLTLTGRRLLRTLEVVCSRWAAHRPDRPGGGASKGGDEADRGIRRLLRSVARRLEHRRRRLADEHKAAAKLVGELMALPVDQRRDAVAAHRFRTLAIADLLLSRARELFANDAHQALELAHLASGVAGRLDPVRYGVATLFDLRARAWMAAGNAHRILGDLRAAEEELDRAGRLIEEGSLEPGLRAELLRLRATLHRYRRRFDDAERLLDQAAAIYRWTGDHHQEGRLMVSKAVLRERQGNPEDAVPLLERALQLLDPDREPRLQMVAWQNLVTQHHKMGRNVVAYRLLPKLRRLTEEFETGRLDHIRVDWTEGSVRLALDDPTGETLLQQAREAFIDEAMPIEAALVSLELAVHHLEAGRSSEAHRLVDELLPLLRARRVHREAMAALLVLQQALRQEQATAAMAREVAATLKRIQEQAGTSNAPS